LNEGIFRTTSTVVNQTFPGNRSSKSEGFKSRANIEVNEEFRKAISEKNIKLENIYNSDETGTGLSFKWADFRMSIGICKGVNVVNGELKNIYMAQPRRQECVTVIECSSASGTSIPSYIIFNCEHILSSWMPTAPPSGWIFTTNTSVADGQPTSMACNGLNISTHKPNPSDEYPQRAPVGKTCHSTWSNNYYNPC
jgi:hypothetical protein